jgi:hypothetical protein
MGLIGAACSAVLWAYQYDPGGPLVRSVASRLGPGLGLGDGLVLFAAICGLFAVVLAIAGSAGGRTRGASVVAIVLGVLALSYPILIWLRVFTRPLLHRSLP